MRISDGSGLDGVSGAAEPEPAVNVTAEQSVYARQPSSWQSQVLNRRGQPLKAGVFGPWVPGLDPAERKAQFRSLQAHHA